MTLTRCDRIRMTNSIKTIPIAPKAHASLSFQGKRAPATRNAATMAIAFCQGRIGETVTRLTFDSDKPLLLAELLLWWAVMATLLPVMPDHR